MFCVLLPGLGLISTYRSWSYRSRSSCQYIKKYWPKFVAPVKMAWRSGGKTNAELIANLKSKIIISLELVDYVVCDDIPPPPIQRMGCWVQTLEGESRRPC